MNDSIKSDIHFTIQHIRKLESDCKTLYTIALKHKENRDGLEERRAWLALKARHRTMAELAVSLAEQVEQYFLLDG